MLTRSLDNSPVTLLHGKIISLRLKKNLSTVFVVFFAYLASNRSTSFALKPSYYQRGVWERFVLDQSLVSMKLLISEHACDDASNMILKLLEYPLKKFLVKYLKLAIIPTIGCTFQILGGRWQGQRTSHVPPSLPPPLIFKPKFNIFVTLPS